MIKIIYNSPAMPQPPYDFILGQPYDLNKIKGKYYIYRSENDKQMFSIGFIKSMFKPCNGYSWDMLEEVVENKENKTSKSNTKSKNK